MSFILLVVAPALIVCETRAVSGDSKARLLKYWTLQSKLVGRLEADQSASFDDSHQEGDENVIFCSNTMNLPTQSNRAAEYLGLRSGYSVYRQTSPDRKSPKASKRKYDCPIFENESPIQPFSSLPHPNDLFGKRSKKEGKKKRIQVNPVNYHSQQLHQKQAKLNMTTNEQQGDSVNDSRIHGRTLHKAYTDSSSRLDSSAQHSSTTDDRNDSSKSFVHSDNAHNNLKRTMQYENIKSLNHFPFSFKTTSKIYEE